MSIPQCIILDIPDTLSQWWHIWFWLAICLKIQWKIAMPLTCPIADVLISCVIFSLSNTSFTLTIAEISTPSTPYSYSIIGLIRVHPITENPIPCLSLMSTCYVTPIVASYFESCLLFVQIHTIPAPALHCINSHSFRDLMISLLKCG